MKKAVKGNKRKIYNLRNFVFRKNKRARSCMLLIRRSYTNLFLTLTDLNCKVISTVSTGQCSDNNNKRIKGSPITLELMVAKVRKILRKIKVRCVELVIRSKVRAQLKSIQRLLQNYGFRITKIKDRRIAAHNGMRGRNIRRT